jgi:hypothetical protein
MSRIHFWRVGVIVIGVGLVPYNAQAQGEIIGGLLGNATDINFYGTWVSIPKGEFKPERNNRIAGVGFELAFDIPGSFGRKINAPRGAKTVHHGDCNARFKKGFLEQDSACADTTYTLVKKTVANQTVYEYEPKVEDFDWRHHDALLELAVGFSQTGALVGRNSGTEMRASIREAPTVSVYGNFGGDHWYGAYVGARTGLVSLVGGRGYLPDGTAIKFEGSTFELGPVGGVDVSYLGLTAFVEYSYMWREVKSIEWGSEKPVGLVPRNANLNGSAIAVGVQFKFKDSDKK